MAAVGFAGLLVVILQIGRGAGDPHRAGAQRAQRRRLTGVASRRAGQRRRRVRGRDAGGAARARDGARRACSWRGCSCGRRMRRPTPRGRTRAASRPALVAARLAAAGAGRERGADRRGVTWCAPGSRCAPTGPIARLGRHRGRRRAARWRAGDEAIGRPGRGRRARPRDRRRDDGRAGRRAGARRGARACGSGSSGPPMPPRSPPPTARAVPSPGCRAASRHESRSRTTRL